MTRNYLLHILKENKVINQNNSLNIKFNKKLRNNPELLQEIINATSFLRGSAEVKIRLHVLLKHITEQPICQTCGKDVYMRLNGKYRYTFPTFCKSSCFSGREDVKEKRKETNLQRYGVENALFNAEIQNKIKQTTLQRYGVENVFKLKEFQDKVTETNMKKYGVRCPCMLKEFQDKATETNMKKYGAKSYTQSHIPDDSLEKINNREWLLHQHHVEKIPLYKIAEDLNVSQPTMSVYFKKHGIEVLTFFSSQGEQGLCEYIESIYSGTVIKNTKSIITPLELDILLPDINIAIEYNGVFWHGETKGKDRRYHLNKTTICREKGIRLIHILDTEWNTKQEIVKSRISSLLKHNNTIYARKTEIRQLPYSVAQQFFEQTHIQGNAPAKLQYGLFYDDALVACMSFGKSRFSKKVEWELIRYSNKLFTNVVGGASKIFKHFVKVNHPKSIITYSDKRWNTGNLYKQLGFEYQHFANPNYYYFNPIDTNKLHHRVHFQKHKLQAILDTFDPNLTEWENMVNNGYDRIWDCGNDVFLLKFPENQDDPNLLSF